VIAQHKTKGHALAVSEGLDRDRAVDEAGNQLSVFGRRGARPFTLEEMRKLYLRDGVVWTVRDEPGTEPVEGKKVEVKESAPATQPAPVRRFPLPRRR
jgi:hypothetical protein